MHVIVKTVSSAAAQLSGCSYMISNCNEGKSTGFSFLFFGLFFYPCPGHCVSFLLAVHLL